MKDLSLFGIGMERRLDLHDLYIDSLEFDNDLIILDKEKDSYTARSEIYIAYAAYLNGRAMKKVMLVEFYPVILYEKNIFINRREDGSLIISDMIKNDFDYIEMQQKFCDLYALYKFTHKNSMVIRNIIEANETYYFVLDYDMAKKLKLIQEYEVISGKSVKSRNIEKIDSEEDLDYLYKELEIRKRLYREELLYVLERRQNLNKIRFNIKYKSRVCLEKILELQTKVSGKEEPDTATAHQELGEFLLLFEDIDKGIGHLKEALEIREKKLPKGHEDTFLVMYELGLLYQHIGDKNKEEDYANRALDIREQITGKNYREGIKIHSFLMRCHFDEIRTKKEVEYKERVLSLHKSMFEEDDEFVADMYYDIAKSINIINKEKSKEYAFKSLDIYRKVLDKNHQKLLKVYFMMSIYFSKDDANYARECGEKVCNMMENLYGKNNKMVDKIRKNINEMS